MPTTPSANNWYVRSGATTGTANGAEWTDAYLTLNTALNASNTFPGDTIWVSDDHAEVQTVTGLTLSTNNISVSNPTFILCANHTSGNIPPNINTDLALTANVTSRDTTLTIANGAMTFYGIHFNAAVGNTTGFGAISVAPGNQSFHRYINCTFVQAGNNTATGPALTMGGGNILATKHTFNGCSFLMTKPLHRLVFNGGETEFINSKFSSNTTITTFMYQSSAAGSYSRARFKRCDLSGMTASFFYDAAQATPPMQDISFHECKGGGISNYIENQVNMGAVPIQMIRTNGAYNSVFIDYWVAAQMTTACYRTGGAFDPTSDNKYSALIETFSNANTSAMFPGTINPIVKWNSDTSDVLTATLYGTWNNSTLLPDNSKFWMEVEYLANSNPSNTMTSVSSSGCNGNNPIIYPWNAANAGIQDFTSVWAAASPNANFSFSTSFHAAQPGPIKVWVKCGVGGGAVVFPFIDPVVYISNSSGGYVSNTALTSNTSLTYNTDLAIINESKKGYTQPNTSIVWTIS